ncbi:MAG: calcium-binding protein [Roseivivax sp.]|nr:calcium-binding protein [Roseivivax sp.]
MGALAASLCLAGTAQAEPRQAVEVYFFGNSLINHLSETESQTNVPEWLNLLARADGRSVAVDGQWGFLRDFADNLPPRPNWSFPGVRSAWNPRIERFGKAGLTALMVNPANFIQYQPPTVPYDGDNPRGESPVDAAVRLMGWLGTETPGTPVYIYEGWADMGGVAADFPPSMDDLARYHALNMGGYHDWYVTLRDALAARVPEADIRLVPVASILAELLTSEPLSSIPVEGLYSDNAPHGRPTLYLLAAMITYSALFETAPPAGLELPDTIEPALADNFADIAARIWAAVQPTLADGQDAAATPDTATAPAPAHMAAPEPAPEPEPATASEPTPEPAPEPESEPQQPETPAQPVQLAAPAATPAPGTIPALAMGLNGIADWSTQHPFINVMKTARPWIGHLSGQWGGMDEKALKAGGYLDEHGWPTGIPEKVTKLETFLFTDQPAEDTYLKSSYEVRYKGTGKLEIGGRAQKVTLADGMGRFEYEPGEGLVSVAIIATDPADPIRDIAIFRADQRDLFEAGALFNPVWLSRIEDLRAVRFMDWMQTNGSPVVHWEDRPDLADYSWVTGVPLEAMIELANQIGADPWFNMPHMADDAYVRAFAEQVKATLDPRLKAYVEYSNEVWNFIFAQAAYARDEGERLWGKSDTGWMEFYGLRAAQVMGLWSDVFGTETQDRLVRVAATHTGWQGLEEYVLTSDRAKAALGHFPQDDFDAYAVTGYFGYEMGGEEYAPQMQAWLDNSEDAARQDGQAQGLKRVFLDQYVAEHRFDRAIAPVAQALLDGSVREMTEVIFPYHAQAAERAGLDLVMYEGGTHVAGHGEAVSDERMTAFFKAFNYTPEMAGIYRALMAGYTGAGGHLFNAFVDVAPASQWGSWGSLRHLSDSNPRWDTLMAFNAAGDGGWQGRDPAAFANGARLAGTDTADTLQGTPEEDTLTGGAGDDTLISAGGRDHIHGGEGEDLLVLPGTIDGYTFEAVPGGLIARSNAATVTLVSVEFLEFAGDGLMIRAPSAP